MVRTVAVAASKRSLAAAGAPPLEGAPFGAEGGIVAVAWVEPRLVRQPVEELARDVPNSDAKRPGGEDRNAALPFVQINGAPASQNLNCQHASQRIAMDPRLANPWYGMPEAAEHPYRTRN